MNKVSFVVEKYLQGNTVFNSGSKVNRDNVFAPFIKLKNEFHDYGFELSTVDLISIEEADIVIYHNMPSLLPREKDKDKSYIILYESELIRPDNYDLEKHSHFNKIFTWHDEFVDNIKYFKINISHLFPKAINKKLIRKKLCTLIAGNKSKKHPLELYSKRIEAIRWFEKNHIDDFDLYGVGWDKYNFSGPKVVRALNRVPCLAMAFLWVSNKKYLSYKGMVDNKKEVMEKYRFSICYENARDIPGYITEKIFDSFFAGCVPIYWGASNISEYIPKSCFIDKRDFHSYEQLYIYIKNMGDCEYLEYLDAIEGYLNGEDCYPYACGCFASEIVRNTIGEKEKNDN